MKCKWTEEQCQTLRDMYYECEQSDIYMMLQYDNWAAIQNKANKLGLKRKLKKNDKKKQKIDLTRKSYTIEEDDYIINNYNLLTVEKISEYLNRTINSIYNRAGKLSLSKDKQWSKDEEQQLIKMYPFYTNKWLSENIFKNKQAHSIRRKALDMGLNKTIEKSVKWYNKEQLISLLQEKAKEIGRTPHCEELCCLGLPSQKTYNRYFGGYQKACDIAGIKPNLFLFKNKTTYIASNGDLCYSKYELIITEFFINNNIEYKKEGLYKDYINDERCGKRRCDWVINGVFIEFFGLCTRKEYIDRMNLKKQICKDNNFPLIDLYEKDITNIYKKIKHIL